MADQYDMGSPLFRIAVITSAVALGAVGIASPAADANDSLSLTVGAIPMWSYQGNEVPQIATAQVGLEAQRLDVLKAALAARVKEASDLYAASSGKASEETRKALIVERNRAQSATVIALDAVELADLAAGLEPAMTKTSDEVKAWEVAEAARKAEEERKAREAAARSAGGKRSSGGGGGGGGAAPSGDPKAYLDGIASSWGTYIQWGDTACGRGSATRVSGCFTGDEFVYVTNSAYSSWSVAKGRGRNVVLHEISHLVIQRKCGTAIVNERFENVTDAYAILIGAGATTGYGYNDADMALAQKIYSGTGCTA